MITIKPFSYVHALNITGIADKNYIDTMKQHEHDATALTVFYDGEIFCCGGVMLIWEGVAEIWTVISPLVHKHPLAFHKFMVEWMDIFFRKYDLVRMQATVDAECTDHVRWIESLGFINETPNGMKKFHAGRDFYLYAKVV
jgi:hypothetical protein